MGSFFVGLAKKGFAKAREHSLSTSTSNDALRTFPIKELILIGENGLTYHIKPNELPLDAYMIQVNGKWCIAAKGAK